MTSVLSISSAVVRRPPLALFPRLGRRFVREPILFEYRQVGRGRMDFYPGAAKIMFQRDQVTGKQASGLRLLRGQPRKAAKVPFKAQASLVNGKPRTAALFVLEEAEADVKRLCKQ